MYTPTKEIDPQRHNIFKTKYTVNQKVCELIIDEGSSENIVSKTVVDKLQLKMEKHPSPYTIGWIKKVSETKVIERCGILFSIGKYYKDEVVCDVIDMEACHILLGWPWQYDVDSTHRGKDNVYVFVKDGRKIILAPMKGENQPKTSQVEGRSLLAMGDFMRESTERGEIYALVVKEMM
ncbi:uncharacterized protein LOC143852441 [Tasmannia lanceolata]|uniref:uncharacterized protein LOC143852441 n=1 Tax=Tasmannia lanceolata TaxID=3420 RepID=UPI00406484DC